MNYCRDCLMSKVNLSSVLIIQVRLLAWVCDTQSWACDKGRWGTVCRDRLNMAAQCCLGEQTCEGRIFFFLGRYLEPHLSQGWLIGWLVCLFIYWVYLSLVKKHSDVTKAAPPGSAGIHPGRQSCRLGGSSSIFQYIKKYDKKSHCILRDATIISEEESSNIR